MAGRFFKRLWHAALILFGIAVLLFLLYELYSAWVHQMVYVSSRLRGFVGTQGWVTHDAHPTAYWFTIALDFFLLILLGGLTAFFIFVKRFEARRLLKLKNRPQIENIVRQTTSER